MRTANMVPAPGLLRTSTLPLNFSMLRLTTSMPTPRPDTLDILSAVENPGSKIIRHISSSFKSRSSSLINPLSMPFFSIFSRFSPLPSSSMMIHTSPTECLASMVTRPVSGLPAANLSAGLSSPWSTAFLIRCTRGSAICSMMVLSTSVSSPMICSVTFLPAFWARSRTRRTIRRKAPLRGIIRMDIATSWMSLVILSSWSTAFSKRSRCRPRKSGLLATMASAMTISPTRSKILSSLSRSTRMACCCLALLSRSSGVPGGCCVVLVLVSGCPVKLSGSFCFGVCGG